MNLDPKLMIVECTCGSGLESCDEYDARGIYLCRVCPRCYDEEMSRYRPEVLANPQYDCDEPIDPD